MSNPFNNRRESQYPLVPSPSQLPNIVEVEMSITAPNWPTVTPEGKINTRQFLQCSNLVVKFIDTLGLCFSAVSRDVSGNIKTLFTRYVQDRDRFKYLQDIIDYDISINTKHTAEALLWLSRGLNFLCAFLQSLVDDYDTGVTTECISSNIKSSYESTLSMHHGFVLRQLFSLLNAAAPGRSTLFQRLSVIVGADNTAAFISHTRNFTRELRTNVNVLFQFYRNRNLLQDS